MYCDDKHCSIRLCKYHWCNAKGEFRNHLIYMQDKPYCKKKDKNKDKKRND